MSIQVNSFQRLNWSLQDLGGTVTLETTDALGIASDGINIGVTDAVKGKASVWMSVEEAKSLRDWLVKSLPA